MKQAQGVIGLPPQRPDEKQTLLEERELQNLLLLEQTAFNDSKLQVIDPDKWKNVGVSVVHAIKILKEHSSETVESMAQLHQFLQKFTQKVVNFMHLTDADCIQLRHKSTKDLQVFQRETEEKFRAFKQIQDQGFVDLRDKQDAQLEINKKIIDDCWAKLEKVKPTELVLKEVHKAIDSNLGAVRQSITDLGSSVSARFLKLYEEELWEDGLFGPIEGIQSNSMKDYTILNINRAQAASHRIENDTKQAFQKTEEKIQELKDITLLELYPELRKAEKQSEELYKQLANCKAQIDLLVNKQESQDTDLCFINQVLDMDVDQKLAVTTIRKQTTLIVSEAVNTTRSSVQAQIDSLSAKTDAEIKALTDKLAQAAIQLAHTSALSQKSNLQTQQIVDSKPKVEKSRRKDGKGQQRDESKTSKNSEEKKQKTASKLKLSLPEPAVTNSNTVNLHSANDVQQAEPVQFVQPEQNIQSPTKKDKSLSVVNEVQKSQSSTQQLETQTLQPEDNDQLVDYVSNLLQQEIYLPEQPAQIEQQSNYQMLHTDKQETNKDEVLQQISDNIAQLEEDTVKQESVNQELLQTDQATVDAVLSVIEEEYSPHYQRLNSANLKVVYSVRQSKVISVSDSVQKVQTPAPINEVSQLDEVLNGDEVIQISQISPVYQNQNQQQNYSQPTTEPIDVVLSDQDSSERTEGVSDSQSSQSDFSNKELDGLNGLCRDLRNRVKGYKRQLDQLETKQMQQVFLGKKFENKVNGHFDRINVVFLEQIVKNQAIHDIINGHYLHTNQKKSPKRKNLNQAFEDQSPQQNRWESLKDLGATREGLKAIAAKGQAGQKSNRNLKIKLNGEVIPITNQHSDQDLLLKSIFNQNNTNGAGFKSFEKSKASIPSEINKDEEHKTERSALQLQSRVEVFPSNAFGDNLNKNQKRRPSPIVHQ